MQALQRKKSSWKNIYQILEIGVLYTEEKASNLEKKNKMLQEDLKQATKELNDARQSVSSVQTELIAVLSIFAAIVLTFSGSLSLLGSIFSEISKAPVFKSILFLLLVGLVVSNIIFLLLYIVGKITNRNIYARSYIFWLNITLASLIVIDFIVWYLNAYCHFLPMIEN